MMVLIPNQRPAQVNLTQSPSAAGVQEEKCNVLDKLLNKTDTLSDLKLVAYPFWLYCMWCVLLNLLWSRLG